MSRLTAVLLVLPLLAATASCGRDLTGPQQAALRELDAARARWAEQELTDYDYDYRLLCFCPPELLQPVRVQVRDGAVTAVHNKADDQPRAPLSNWSTIPGLFDKIQDYIERPGSVVKVDYDSATGIPTSASIDPIPNAVDDEIGFSAEGLAAVPATSGSGEP
jgi:hypothetical protein